MGKEDSAAARAGEKSELEWRPSGIRPVSEEGALSEPPPRSSDPAVHAQDRELLEAVERFFSELSEDTHGIDVPCLKEALGIQSDYLASRVHAAFDRNKDGLIDRNDFIQTIRRLVRGTPRDKLLFAFRINDLDSDGYIELPELVRMLTLGFAEDKVAVDAVRTARMARVLLATSDHSRDGRLSFSEFEAALRRHPDVLSQITRSAVRWAAPNEAILARLEEEAPGPDVLGYLKVHAAAAIVIVAWVAANLALFASARTVYAARGATMWIQIARGFGACLNFNGALILIPVLRRFWTWARHTAIGRVAPIDGALAFHRLVGSALLVLSVLHSAAHVANLATLGTTGPEWQRFFTQRAGATGALLLAILIAMWAFSRPSVRKQGRFELFYYTHLLYPAWFGLALFHGPAFWKWTALPLLGLAVEYGVRLVRRAAPAAVVSSSVLRSGVTRLELEKPEGFEYKAGQYVFLRVPSLSRREWHPFTLSSAPEAPRLTLHIRSEGDWTSALRALVERRSAGDAASPFGVHIDGPYGAPSERVFAARCAVLIAGGIGVTPFASVLQSIVLRSRVDPSSPLEKVHFFWLNRDRYSFEWLLELLTKLEELDERKLVTLHIFMTGGRGDASTSLTDLARSVEQAGGSTDLVTGLAARTRMGRPDWDRELTLIAEVYPSEAVDVFFCGGSGLAKDIRRACVQQGIRLHEEGF